MAGKGKRRRNRRRGQGRRTFTFSTPIVGYAEEGVTDSLSFTDLVLIDNKLSDLFMGVPWRLLSVRLECSLVMGSDPTTTQDPALIQFSLNSGQMNNIENVASVRFLVSVMPKAKILRMPSPNPWKEDAERTQSLIYIENFSVSGRNNSPVMYYLTPTFQFGRIPFDKPSPKFRGKPRPPSSDASSPAASLPSLSSMAMG